MSVIGIVLLAAVCIFIYFFNGMVIKRHRWESNLALVNVFFKRRMDMLPELIELLPETLADEALQLRSLVDEYDFKAALQKKSDLDLRLTGKLGGLWEKLAGQQIDRLAETLKDLERNEGFLITARLEYNQAVENLNQALSIQPWKIFGAMMKISVKEPWSIPEKEWAKPLKMSRLHEK